MKIRSKKTYIGIVLIIAILGGGYYFSSKKPKIDYVTAVVQPGKLIQTVSETGTVKRASEVNLNFIAQGRIATTTVAVGQRVKKGQVLAELDNLSLKLQAQQAAAGLSVAKANEQKALNGASAEDVRISQSSVAQAKTQLLGARRDYEKIKSLTDETIKQAEVNLNNIKSVSADASPLGQAVKSAQSNLANTKATYQKTVDNRLSSALSVINDKNSSANTALDAMNRILTDENAKDTLGVLDSSSLNQARLQYVEAMALLDKSKTLYTELKSTRDSLAISMAMDNSEAMLLKVSLALNYTFTVLEKTITSSKLSQTVLDGFKATVSGQISVVNAALAAIQASSQALSDSLLAYDTAVTNSQAALSAAQANYNSGFQSAQNAINSAKISQAQQLASVQSRIDSAIDAQKTAEAQLAKLTANTRYEDLAVVMAQVKQAQANLDSANNLVNNGIIKAPFDGLITQVNYQAGEQSTGAKPVVVMQGNDSFEIEVDIAESDIAKLVIGNMVEIDFDAFGADIKFKGELVNIDPAQTVIQEVVYYKCKISNIESLPDFESYQNILKPGMTANVVIMARQKDNVLIVANRAIIEKADKTRIVRTLINGQVTEKAVEVGMRGDDGLTEVLKGLSIGDEIVLSINGQ